jgi:hypothetical protein
MFTTMLKILEWDIKKPKRRKRKGSNKQIKKTEKRKEEEKMNWSDP